MKSLSALIIVSETTDSWVSDDDISDAIENDPNNIIPEEDAEAFRDCLSDSGMIHFNLIEDMNTFLLTHCWPFRVTDIDMERPNEDVLYWKVIKV